MDENELDTYDFIINDEGEVMLLLHAQETEPKNARIEVDVQEKSAVQGTREERLPINIEGEPRSAERGEAARQALRSAVENSPDGDRAALREEAIRQILEEFLA